MSKRRRAGRWRPAVLVAVLTLAVFLPAVGNGFVNWDDDENFLWNPHYRGLGWPQLRWMFTTAHQSVYVPMAWVTLGLDYLLWGMSPWGYHLTSILLHSANAGLFSLVAFRLLRAGFDTAAPRAAVASGETPLYPAHAHFQLGAVVAALLFAVHPLRVESVAWVTERRDVVAGLFTLSTVLAYLRAQRGGGGPLRIGWYWTAVGLFALALLSKAIVVGLPLVLLALDVYPLRRTAEAHGRRSPWPRLIAEKLPFVALSVAISALTLGILAGRGLMTGRQTLGVVDRLAVTAHALSFYLEKTLVPQLLSPLYALPLPVEPASARYLGPAILVVLLTGVVAVAGRRWPAGLVAWLTYVVFLLPVSGLFHSGAQAAADRYTYFASWPGALLAGAGAAWCWREVRDGRRPAWLGRVAVGGAATLILALGALTVGQIGVWRDSESLWRQAAIVDPDSDIPVFYLGWALTDAGRYEEARAHFARAITRVSPDQPRLRAQLTTHLGIVALRSGNLVEAERDFRDALALDPHHPVAMIRLAAVRLARGDAVEADRLVAESIPVVIRPGEHKVWELRQAIEEMPPAWAGQQARLTIALALRLQRLGELEAAAAQYRLALALAPRSSEAWNNLGVIYAVQTRYQEALDAFVTALRVAPGSRDACRNGLRAAEAVGRRPAELEACGDPAR
jgi:Tfp pilus assembly protein PilF